MPTQSPPGPSRRTLIALLILYLLSIGTSALFLAHYIDIPHLPPIKGTTATVPNRPVAPQGKHPGVVYFYNKTGGDGFLMLYKASTGQKVEVFRLENNTIEYAQVSPDGQWILFIAGDWRRKTTYQLQMIRINGQQREILYTFPPVNYWRRLTAQWSPDQKSVLLSMNGGDSISTLGILNMTTRKVRTLVQITSAQYEYYALKWLDRTHVFVFAPGFYYQGKETPPTRLYLLDVTAKLARRPSDLKLLVAGVKGSEIFFDTSPDGKRLYAVQQVQNTTTIWVEPVAGGKRQILSTFAGEFWYIRSIRVFTTYMLMVVMFDYKHSEMWRLPLDASSHTVLFSSTDYTVYVLNRMTQYVRSNVSSDETMLAFETYNRDLGAETLLVSPLPDAKATKIEVFPPEIGTSFIVGWIVI